MVTRTQAIKNFLLQSESPRDLVGLYNEEMECQVYVTKGDNQVLNNREYKGKKFLAYQCKKSGIVYKPFRIPYDSMTEGANYDDPPMSFDLKEFAEGIGLTGWNWKKKKSIWVGFDFDSITNHKKGLEEEELKQIYDAVFNLPYATIRTSTTGSGFHIYVFIENVTTLTHTEHQRLAKAIIEKMSMDCGYNFQAKVDQMGQILWVWATKMTPEGLQLVKQGETLKDIPLNWNTKLESKKTKIRPELIEDKDLEDYNKLAERRLQTQLDDKHRKVIEELSKIEGYETYWNADHGMLITHTIALKEVHKKLSLRGPFETASSSSSSKNCFGFPLEDGAWTIRRHGRGVTEASSWVEDAGGWTHCFFNRPPDFHTACKINAGVEDTDGSFVFTRAELAIKAAKDMEVNLEVPADKQLRKARLKMHNKTHKLIVEIDAIAEDAPLDGWIKKGKAHQFISKKEILGVDKIDLETSEEEIRHCVTEEGEDAGWYIKGVGGKWIDEPRTNVLSVLSSMGHTFKEREMEIGRLTTNYWTLISEPFQPEYPGDRRWNRRAAQLKYPVREEDLDNLKHPTWSLLLEHLGRGLNDAVLQNKWCVENGIQTGASYLKCWVASIVQYPKEPLPYLFFYGKENSGKTSFHDALSLIFTKGVERVATALESTSGFNAEIEGAVVGVIEELHLSKQGHRNGSVINRIKDLVTARRVSIHCKGQTPYMRENTLHFVQTGNSIDNAPVFSGDTRIVVIPVYPLTKEIPKIEFDRRLEDEAIDFTTAIVKLDIPKPDGRLRIPVVNTDAKDVLAESNTTDIELFVKTELFVRKGCCVNVRAVWDAFCQNNDIGNLTMLIFNKQVSLLTGAVKGKYGVSKSVHWANLTLDPDEPETEPFDIVNGYLKKGVNT